MDKYGYYQEMANRDVVLPNYLLFLSLLPQGYNNWPNPHSEKGLHPAAGEFSNLAGSTGQIPAGN